jgi:hypothetical protein
MKKILLFLLLLSACTSYGGIATNPDIEAYTDHDDTMTCGDIALELAAMSDILTQQQSILDDPIARQVGKQTISTAGSQAAASAGVGYAGPFIGIFVNAITGMVERRAATPNELIEKAQLRRVVLNDLFTENECD